MGVIGCDVKMALLVKFHADTSRPRPRSQTPDDDSQTQLFSISVALRRKTNGCLSFAVCNQIAIQKKKRGRKQTNKGTNLTTSLECGTLHHIHIDDLVQLEDVQRQRSNNHRIIICSEVNCLSCTMTLAVAENKEETKEPFLPFSFLRSSEDTRVLSFPTE